jgi:aspartyl-tRNA(Asn)/glutamyl-tRNA(Gln) amidotransferase subunit A
MSNYFREDLLFNLAYSFEQSTNWHKLKPSMLNSIEKEGESI